MNTQRDFARCLAISILSGAKNMSANENAVYATIVDPVTNKNKMIILNGANTSLALATNNGIVLGNSGEHIDTTINPRLSEEKQGDLIANIIANKQDQIYYGELPEEELDNLKNGLNELRQIETTGNILIDNGVGIASAMVEGFISSHNKAMASIQEGIEEQTIEGEYSANQAAFDSNDYGMEKSFE